MKLTYVGWLGEEEWVARDVL